MSLKRLIINLIRYWKYKFKYRRSLILTPYLIGNISIGESSTLNREVIFQNSTIKKHSYINRNTIVSDTDIGNFCSISYNCVIGAKEHSLMKVSSSPKFESNKIITKRTIIEDDVWIGANVVIKSGVKIGKGAVIGAGAVVVKNVDPYSICAGIPAKHIKSRLDYFTDKGQQVLLSINFDTEFDELEKINESLMKEIKYE